MCAVGWIAIVVVVAAVIAVGAVVWVWRRDRALGDAEKAVLRGVITGLSGAVEAQKRAIAAIQARVNQQDQGEQQ